MIAVVSPELQRGGVTVKSVFNAATLNVHGVEPQYQDDPDDRSRQWPSAAVHRQRQRAARGGHRRRCDQAAVRHARQHRSDGAVERPSVHGDRPDPEEGSGQQLQRPGQRQGVRSRTRRWRATFRGRWHAGVLSNIVVAPHPWVVEPVVRRAGSPDRAHRGHRLAARARSASRPRRATTTSIRTTATRSRCGTPRSNR